MMTTDKKSKTPLYLQLYEQIKADILNGTLKAGTKLQSSRTLSAELQISRNTVELAYGQLYAEGFLISKPRQGYFIELPLIEGSYADTVHAESMDKTEVPEKNNIVFDFQSKRLNPDEFPFAKWKSLLNKCFRNYQSGLLQYGCPLGEPELRSEIQRHLYHYRQVKCSSRQIVVGPGTQFCLDLICPLFMRRGHQIAVEEPGYHRAKATLQNHGAELCPITLDAHGMDIRQLNATRAVAAYVTPSHQYPMGMVMSKERRMELAEWAKQNDAFIIEDDYNSFFQYDLKPLPSVHSFCGDHVIYMGSFSELLFPSIGVSYMVLPEQLLEELCKAHCHNATFVPFLTQKTLELFMREGLLESHIRKTVKSQRKKRDLLVSALQKEFGENLHMAGTCAGLHLILQIGWAADEDELIQRALSAGVAVQKTSEFWSLPTANRNGCILLHYGGMPPEQIPAAVGRLKKAWS